jgi:hypothetical protein
VSRAEGRRRSGDREHDECPLSLAFVWMTPKVAAAAATARKTSALQAKALLPISQVRQPCRESLAVGELARRFVRCFASPRRAGEVVDSSVRARLFAAHGPFEQSRKET